VDDGLIVSILALGIALGSLALAVRADRRAGRAEAHGLRAHVVVELHASSGSRASTPRPTPAHPGPAHVPGGRRFELRARNVGREVARDVHVWLEDESGRVVADTAGGTSTALAPGEDPVEIALTVPDAALPPPPVSFSVWMSWTDRAGRHDRVPAGVSVST
jgi:hypothetical protein